MNWQDRKGKTVWGIIGYVVTNILYVVYPPSAAAKPILDPIFIGLAGVGAADKVFKLTKAMEKK